MKVTHRKDMLSSEESDSFNSSGLLYISTNEDEFYHLDKMMSKIRELKTLNRLGALEVERSCVEALRKELGWTTHILDGVLGLKKEWNKISHKGFLSRKEVKCLFSVLMIYQVGMEVFTSATDLNEWMFRAQKKLDGLQPVLLLADPISANIVERMIRDKNVIDN